MTSRLWVGYAALATVATGAYFLVDGTAGRLLLYAPLGISAAVAVLVGVRVHRPARPLPWFVIALGVAAFALGDVIYYGYEAAAGEPPPLPYFSDVLYLGCYVFLVAGFLMRSHPRVRGDRAALVDAAIIVVGVGLPMWVFFVQPYATDTAASLLVRAVTSAYPVADVALLAAATWLWCLPGRRTPSDVLLLVAVPPMLAADIAYGSMSIAGTWRTGTVVDLGWLLFYSLVALAALHPSAGWEPPDKPPPAAAAGPQSWLRIGGLAAAATIAPGMLVVEDALALDIGSVPVATAFLLLSALSLARVALLVGDLARAEQRQRSTLQFQALVQGGSDLITLVDRAGVVRYQSPSSQRVLGVPAESLLGTALVGLAHPDDAPRLAAYVEDAFATRAPGALEVRLEGSPGWQWVEVLASPPAPDEDGALCVVLTGRDVGERRLLEEQLTRQALHDPLTGLANRRLFTDRVTRLLAQRGGSACAVLFIDLDDFKTVNDSLGHGAGDMLLVEVADRLLAAVRQGDSVARLGGDEFAVLLSEDVEPGTAEQVSDRVLAALQAPVQLGQTEIACRASIGIAPACAGDDPVEVLRKADVAMYVAKGSGKGCARTYDDAMHLDGAHRLELLADLRRAVTSDELRLHYQPTVDLQSGAVVGVEALVRWQHPVRGLVSPGEFIPLAEESGLVVPLGRWVLQRACDDAAAWPVAPDQPPVSIAVNLSSSHLGHPDVVDDVRLALAASGLDPARLVLEITETSLVDDSDTVLHALHALKSLGVRLAVDDFGTGYSSLSYLRRLPIDVLKVDKSFVDGLGTGQAGQALVQAILDMARSMRLSTVAEGIEQQVQLDELTVLGCDTGQGYLLSHPVPLPELVAMLSGRVRLLDGEGVRTG